MGVRGFVGILIMTLSYIYKGRGRMTIYHITTFSVNNIYFKKGNFNIVFETLEKEKGNHKIKGDLIKNAFLTSTMGVSYKIKLPKNI